jgi:hypothetical protein
LCLCCVSGGYCVDFPCAASLHPSPERIPPLQTNESRETERTARQSGSFNGGKDIEGGNGSRIFVCMCYSPGFYPYI